MTTDMLTALYRVEIEGKLFGAYTDKREAGDITEMLRKQGMDAVIVPVVHKAA